MITLKLALREVLDKSFTTFSDNVLSIMIDLYSYKTSFRLFIYLYIYKQKLEKFSIEFKFIKTMLCSFMDMKRKCFSIFAIFHI